MAGSPRRGGWRVPWGAFTFTRAGEGSRLIAAPGTGAAAFMAFSASDVLRLENRGDGAGDLALFERASENLALYSRELDNGAWALTGYTRTPDQNYGCDGTAIATRFQGATGTIDQYTGGTGDQCGSVWMRRTSGSGAGQMVIYNSIAAAGNASLTTTYDRISSWTNGAVNFRAVEVVDRTASGGIAAYTADLLVDMVQMEDGRYPTSAIRTTNPTATRGADTAAIAIANLPPEIYTERGRFRNFSPIFGSADLAGTEVFWLLSVGTGEQDGIRYDAATNEIQAIVGGSIVAVCSLPGSWNRHDLLGAIGWDPITGEVFVDGVSGGVGTPFSWPTDDVRVGGSLSAAFEVDARLGALGSW